MAFTAITLCLLYARGNGQGVTTVNVATIAGGDAGANAFYATDMRFFEKAGLDVRLTAAANAPAAVAALASGAADIALSNVATAAAARTHGIPLRFIAPAAMVTADTNTDLLVVAPDSPVRSGADLNGKTIGIPGLKSLQQVHVRAWIDNHGGDSRTVKFVEVPFPQVASALAAHRIDAGLVTEPFSTASKSTTRSLGSPLQSVAPRYLLLGWVATDSWINAHPDVAARYALAIRQASEWANNHHAESAAILMKYTKVDPAVAGTMARATFATEVSEILIAPPLDAALRYGIIDRKPPASDLIWHQAVGARP